MSEEDRKRILGGWQTFVVVGRPWKKPGGAPETIAVGFNLGEDPAVVQASIGRIAMEWYRLGCPKPD